MYGVYPRTYVLVKHSEAACIPMPEGKGFYAALDNVTRTTCLREYASMIIITSP